jgi:hypothetical protein
MKRFALLALGALGFSACGEVGPMSLEGPSYTITMPGNVSECGTIDFASCFAKVDNQFKVLYERNNTLSRRGEADYDLASRSNNELATVYLNPTYTVADALRNLDRFIREVENGLARGDYSECAGTQILERANWLRAKLVANDADMSDAPPFVCEVSPVSVSGSGSGSTGVTLTVDDPYHFTQDTYNTGLFHTYTYFVVERQNGVSWDVVVTTAAAEQTGPETFSLTDPAATAAGTYVYRVRQCDTVVGCSTPAQVSVVVSDTTTGTCPHDNRNGFMDKDDKKPKCEKDAKEDKDHDISKRNN